MNRTYDIQRGELTNGDTTLVSDFRFIAGVEVRPFGVTTGSAGFSAYATEPCPEAGWRGVEADLISLNIVAATTLFDTISAGSNINHLFDLASSIHENITPLAFDTIQGADLRIYANRIEAAVRGLLANPDHPVVFDEFHLRSDISSSAVEPLVFYTVVEMSGDWGTFSSDTLSYYLIQ